jgi:hypothetical protein
METVPLVVCHAARQARPAFAQTVHFWKKELV